MSRILKQAEIFISEPMVIKLEEICPIAEELESFSLDQSALEDEIQQTREASQEILKETEEMVRDLLEKARLEANSIITAAHNEAEEIKSSAREEAGLILEESRNTGYAEGTAQARKEIEEDRMMARKESQKLVDEACEQKLKIIQSCEADMVKLSITIARKIIAGELQTNPKVVVNITREAVAYLNENRQMLIRINPQEVLPVLDAINLGMVSEKDIQAIDFEVQADPGVTAGGCRVESEEGAVDATLETRLARVEQSLLGEIDDFR